jgi:ComF family protein
MAFRSPLLRSLLPATCLLCDAELPAHAMLDLCAYCRAALPWNTPCCQRCAEPLEASSGLPADSCHRCRQRPPPFARTLAPLRFEGFAGDWVRRLKDRRGMVEGHLLGELLAGQAARCYAVADVRPDVLVPVPLTWRRLARRGHNQAIALAVPVARRLGVPLLRRVVVRAGRGRAQRRLSRRERLANPTIRFVCRRNWTDAPCIGLVDDVMTTGATASALTEVLLAAGAGEVHVLCATRTPR